MHTCHDSAPPHSSSKEEHFRQTLRDSNFNCFSFCNHVLHVCVDNGVFDCRLIKDDYPSSLRLIQTGLHEHHHHLVDVYCKPDDSHHGDQDNQDVDQIDDKGPLLI